MTIAIYLFASLFCVIAVMMFWAYRRLRHYGLFVMAMIYGIAGALAFALTDWWPLAAGFAFVWMLKLAGLNPDGDLLGPAEKDREKKDG